MFYRAIQLTYYIYICQYCTVTKYIHISEEAHCIYEVRLHILINIL